MRLLKLGIYHPAYLGQFYAQRPGLATQPFDVQHAALMQDCFGSSDFWTTALNRMGYETNETVANVEPMQKSWANEHGITYDANEWLFDIATAQVEAFQPEALIVADYSTLNADFLRHLKRRCPSIRLVLGWCGAPFRETSVFLEWDIVLSCVPELVQYFRLKGHRCYHLNHAFAPTILDRIRAGNSPSADFVFLGSIVKKEQFHEERERILLALVEQTNLQIWSDISQPSASQRRGTLARQWAYDAVHAARRFGLPDALLSMTPVINRMARWESRPEISQPFDEGLAARAHPPLFGLEMFQQLHDSKVALNTHIDISPVSASNMRLFEATGVGTCLLTDWKENLSELFEPEVEVLTYRDAAECLEKVRYILDHEEERRAIADAGQRRVLREHTFTHRAMQIDAIINGELSKA
jgi:spore maturation protein CgeB